MWIFDSAYEQQNLIASDKSVITLLRERVKRTDIFFDVLSDQKKIKEIERFIDENKSDVEKCLNKIPDLVLAKTIRQKFRNDFTQFLIIELKRPTVKIDKKCREQAREVFEGILSGTKGAVLLLTTSTSGDIALFLQLLIQS